MGKRLLVLLPLFLLKSQEGASQLHLKPITDSLVKAVSLRILPQNFYNQHLGFFCKQELRLQKLSSLPVYFRIGAKEHVDYLERKPNTIWKPGH